MKKEKENIPKNMERETKEMERLFLTASLPAPEEGRKARAVERLMMELHRHPIAVRIPFAQKLLTQAGYLSPLTWVLQAVLFAAAALLLGGKQEWQSLSGLIGAAAVAPLFGLIGCTEIARSFFHGMWELEDACRFPLRYVMSMRMLILGLGDLLAFTVLLLLHAGTGGPVLLTAAFLLVPFHLSNIVYLLLLTGMGGKCPAQLLAAVGILLAVLFSRAGETLIWNGNTAGTVSMAYAAGMADPAACMGWVAATFAGMLGTAALFVKKNLWERKSIWN